MTVKYFLKLVLCSVFSTMAAATALAQTFSSGSTGSDGALNYSTPGTYVFDPRTFAPALDPAGDNIFNFTTITIAAGVTVKLTGATFNTGVVWLASGAVKIDGTIDISGQDGFGANNTTQRTYTIPGAGGYGGGYPAIGSNPGGAGSGPAGGGIGVCGGNAFGGSGGTSANQFIVPLIGGSGGGAYGADAGGAGGGAILIASSASVSGAGSIKANGGNAFSASGPGGGGSIRLVAPTVTITGNLNASSGTTYSSCQGGPYNGIVRIEAFQIGAIAASGNLYTATPFGLFLSSAGVPSIKVATIGGNAVASSPTGTFTVPDVTVNSNSPLPVVIQASNVPLGTTVTLVIFSENGPDQSITSSALTGTLAASTAIASVTLPSGFSKGFVKASFTQ